MAREMLRAQVARFPLIFIACCMCLFYGSALHAAGDKDSAEKDPAASDGQQQPDAPEADAATKKLMAAHGLFQRGLFNLAAQQYADFLSDYPKHAQRTPALYALAQHEEAAATFDRLIREHARSQYEFDAMLLRAQALDALGKSDLAIAQYRRAADSAPAARRPDARYGLGVALEKSGKHTEAIAELSAAATAQGVYAN